MLRFPLILLACIFILSLQAQNFTIPEENFPFDQVIDWKGQGAIFVNKDPKGNSNQIFLTFVGNEARSLWQETMIPKNRNPYVIYANATRYIYFMENTELENGKANFYQLNSAGNFKTTTCNHTVAMKKIGYAWDDLKLVDIVVTDKALVHLFQYEDKEEKTQVLIGAFMTHHNFQSYAAVIGKTSDQTIKDKTASAWQYAGSTDDEILFYAYSQKDKKYGIELTTFNSKGEKKSGQFREIKGMSAAAWKTTAYGMRGASYLKTTDVSLPVVVQMNNGKLYALAQISNQTQLLSLENNEWKTIRSVKVLNTDKRDITFGVHTTNEGLIISKEEKEVFLPFDAKLSEKSTSANAIFNPSKIAAMNETDNMVFDANNKWLFFDANQLFKKGGLNLELKGK
jgi:hypothetical protein